MADEDFPNNEREAVTKEVAAMMEFFNRGDAKGLLERTHPSIYELAKGKENFEAAFLKAAKQIMDQGIVIESFDVGLPKKLYKAGNDSICFVPETTVMTVGGRRIKSTSYMVAIKDGDGIWRYLDGAGARRDPTLWWMLLPDLPKEVALPENTIAEIGDEEVEKGGTGQPATSPESKLEGGDKPQPEAEGHSR